MDFNQLKSYFNLNPGKNPNDDTATVLGVEGKSYRTTISYLNGNIFRIKSFFNK